MTERRRDGTFPRGGPYAGVTAGDLVTSGADELSPLPLPATLDVIYQQLGR